MPRRISLLLVTASRETAESIARAVPAERFAPIRSVPGAGEARAEMQARLCDIVVIDAPLADEAAARLTADLSEHNAAGVLLLVDPEQYDAAFDKACACGVMVLKKPLDPDALNQALGVLASAGVKLRKMTDRAETLQAKMDEIQLVNRAKLLLVQKLRMTEAEAHRFIEKSAMDRCEKRLQIAENIIRTYDN